MHLIHPGVVHFAVAFLVLVGGSLPSLWAIPLLVALVAARPLFGWLLDQVGHGELQVLLGFTLAVAVGAGGFAAVGLKADLGALVAGVLLARHERAGRPPDQSLVGPLNRMCTELFC